MKRLAVTYPSKGFAREIRIFAPTPPNFDFLPVDDYRVFAGTTDVRKMVKATCLVSFLHGISSGENLNTQDTLAVYKNLRMMTSFLGVNLIIHGSLGLYYGTMRPHSSPISLGVCLSTASLAILGGVAGFVAGLSHGTSTARACMFGWILMGLHQAVRTTIVLVNAHSHDHPSHVDPHVEGLILGETVCLVLMEGLFVWCLAEYIHLCRWYKNVYVLRRSFDAYEPLIASVEDDDQVVAAAPTAPLVYA